MIKYFLVSALVLYTLVRCIQDNRLLIGSNLGYIPALAVEAAPHLTEGTICARKPHIVWYLNEQFARYPMFTHVPMPATDILSSLRKNHVDYIFLSGIEWVLRPETRPWFNPQNVPPDFVLRAHVEYPPVYLYQIDHSMSPPP